MRTAIIFFALAVFSSAAGQTTINKVIPVKSGQEVVMHFDYPDMVKVTTWEGSDIQIGGTVSINNGESDDAFDLNVTSSASTISIRSKVNGLKSLPHRITVTDGATKITFKNEAEFKKYQSEHGRTFDMVSNGVDMEITIEIKVPRNIKTSVESVYGMVEVKSFAGPLTVKATYGGVDAALTEKSTGSVSAETHYGEVYTNLDSKFGSEGVGRRDFFTYVTAKPGSGPAYSFESKYGNVYLRKAN